eukprot:SAG31_NODE_723_length_12568_cov_3.102494_8_plen_78_part_00
MLSFPWLGGFGAALPPTIRRAALCTCETELMVPTAAELLAREAVLVVISNVPLGDKTTVRHKTTVLKYGEAGVRVGL